MKKKEGGRERERASIIDEGQTGSVRSKVPITIILCFSINFRMRSFIYLAEGPVNARSGCG